MIELFFAPTPNGKKIVLMLEECAIPYKLHTISLKDKQQFTPEFLAMNPNGKIPVLRDTDETTSKKVTVWESGAILYYLAEKTGKFFGNSLEEKTRVMTWLMFQMSGIGPYFGNHYYAKNYMTPPSAPMAQRFEVEGKRLLQVMESRFDTNSFLSGQSYTIADIATFPWVHAQYMSQPDWFATTPRVKHWMNRIKDRPAAQKIL